MCGDICGGVPAVRNRSGAVRYGAALCGAFFAVFAAADYILYRRRVSELEEIKSRITISCEGLPKTKDGVVSAFTGMVTELYGALPQCL